MTTPTGTPPTIIPSRPRNSTDPNCSAQLEDIISTWEECSRKGRAVIHALETQPKYRTVNHVAPVANSYALWKCCGWTLDVDDDCIPLSEDCLQTVLRDFVRCRGIDTKFWRWGQSYTDAGNPRNPEVGSNFSVQVSKILHGFLTATALTHLSAHPRQRLAYSARKE
jgi:hypothetical protein